MLVLLFVEKIKVDFRIRRDNMVHETRSYTKNRLQIKEYVAWNV